MSAVPRVAAPSTTKPSLAPSRRWLQFSLRSLTIFMVVCSFFLGALGWRLQRARKQAAAVATIRELQGLVLYDFEWRAAQESRPVPQSPWPTFLVESLSQDFFHDVYAVNTAGQPGDTRNSGGRTLSNQDKVRFWDCVTQFPHLHQLCLSGDWMDQDGLARLRNPQEIKTLNITSFPVADDDLTIIGSMTNLRTLQLYGSNCPITDAGIASLDNLTALEALILGHSKITDNAAPHLAKHRKLANLQLVGNHLTDKSTPWLGQLTEMSLLSLQGTEIGDAGLGNLKNLTKLEHLSVGGTQITDEGLVHLAHLTSLRSLSVRRTKVTPVGIARFKAQRPACGVFQ